MTTVYDTNNANVEDEDYDGGGAKLFERSRIKALADERETVQKKTFTKWVNSHLTRVSCRIADLYTDLRDGKMLIRLLEVLSGDKLPKPTKGKMRIHCLENVDKALTFLKEKRVHMENMGSHDIVDGNHRLTLGLIWTIILRFQIQDIMVEMEDNQETKNAKDALLLWCQMKTAGYTNVNIRNFTTSWRDGLAFNALIHKHRPDVLTYNNLQKSNPVYNLNNAFNVADQKLGIPKLLDPEDVTVDHPDEKSIITYVVTYYHYFSKMRAETVSGKRIGKVVDHAMENDKMVTEYEKIASGLLDWIQQTIVILNDRTFANSLPGVGQQLVAFNTYRTVEKPPKFMEKGNLEVLLFTLHSKMRANNQKPYTPKEGRLISDINKAWESLEKAEHNREIALREELRRQEKLEQLAARFDRKAAMRETWLGENQRLVSQDNFGYELPAVEAAAKKHEAIETDTAAYEERVLSVVAIAQELEKENYNDSERVNARKDNILRMWNYLLELLRGRRLRLDLSMEIQKIFQENLLLIDWIEETKVRLLSEDYGKHLYGVEDLLQKHALLEADITAQGDKVQSVNNQAEKFLTDPTPDKSGYFPVDPQIVQERIDHLQTSYADLLRLAQERQARLAESREFWQFIWDISEEESWIKEKAQIMSSTDIGRDLTSVSLLQAKQKAMEEEIAGHQPELESDIKVGEDLITAQKMGAPQAQQRIGEVRSMWDDLQGLTRARNNRLQEANDMYQFFTDADDVDTWMLDTLRLVSSDDVGRDEAATLSLLKKHKDVADELKNYATQIDGLHQQAANLGAQDRDSPEVQARLGSVDRRYRELNDLARQRHQRLLDALALCKVFNEADGVESWIDDKEKSLQTMEPGIDLESSEVVQARFDRFDKEMEANAPRVAVVNQLARQLVAAEHPDSDQALAKQNHLNARWAHLRELTDQQREKLASAMEVQTFTIECTETTTWIREKTRLLQSTEDLGNDLVGLMQMQRKLRGMENDLAAIQAKLDELQREADKLAAEHPEDADEIRQKFLQITDCWEELKMVLKERDAAMSEARDLQQFLRDLDDFQAWLSKMQTEIASEDIPETLQEAEKLSNQHAALREEIDGQDETYGRIKETGQKVTEGQTDAQYMFLSQRLEALDEGWDELHQMWDNRQNLLAQSLSHQLFLRDAKQAEVLLNQQEAVMAKAEIPQSLEAADEAIRRQENFLKTMDAHDEKINNVISYGQRLCSEDHYAADRIDRQCDKIDKRRQRNRQSAERALENLHDNVQLQRFLEESNDLEMWIQEKLVVAQDVSYDEARSIHNKWQKHEAFKAELAANKDRLEKLKEHGQQLIAEKPAYDDTIESRMADLQQQWDLLEDTTENKANRLFAANKFALFEEGLDDVDNWVNDLETTLAHEDLGKDLTSVNLLLKRQEMLESQVVAKKDQVGVLHSQMYPEEPMIAAETVDGVQSAAPPSADMEHATVKKVAVEQKFNKMAEPLAQRRVMLEANRQTFQLQRDIEDEKLWINEKIPQALSEDVGNSLMAVQTLINKNNTLRSEVEGHEPHIAEINERGDKMVAEGHPKKDQIRVDVDELNDSWDRLKECVESRQERLADSKKAQQYFFDAAEAEAWMSEQELYMMGEDRAKDEGSAESMLKKHVAVEKAVEDYAENINELSEEARRLVEEEHPQSDQISRRQAQIDKSYAGLKDLSEERRARLDEMTKLFSLNREVDDLEQWIAEREVVAGSHELGQDYEHVTMLQERFREFARDTHTIGQERVAKVNEMADKLISSGHSDAAIIAEWKDGLNEAWADLLELIDTRTQMLAASYELHKFYYDAKEILNRIEEKRNTLPQELGKDSATAENLSRKHAGFENEIVALGTQVQALQEDAARLMSAYAGDKAKDIQAKEAEVVNAWRNLQATVDRRKAILFDNNELHRFLNMVRNLMLWMEDVIIQINNQERARDVSGVELLMNQHQNIKAEIDARDDSFTQTFNFGKELLSRSHYAAKEIRDKLVELGNRRQAMIGDWGQRWEFLQLILEVYQFARDAHVAEDWLVSQEPYLTNDDIGNNLDEVEVLIKKHEAFEKTFAAQEERFSALERLTTFELRELRRRQEEEYQRQHPTEEIPPRKESPSMKHKVVDQFMEDLEASRQEPAAPEQNGDDRYDGPERVEDSRLEYAPPAPAAQEVVPAPAESPEGQQAEPSSSSYHQGLAEGEVREGAERRGLMDEGVEAEGMLARKHEWDALQVKSSNRSWNNVYVALQGPAMSFFKDKKSKLQEITFHGEAPVDLTNCSVTVASDYTKKKHVFRLQLENGAEYLFQARDDQEMDMWVSNVAAVNSAQESHPQKSATFPASASQSGKGKGKKKIFTLKKK